MNPETQDQLPDLSVDDAAAALGFSTTLSDTMLQPMLDAENMPLEDEANPTGEEEVQMDEPVEAPVEPQEAPEQEEPVDVEAIKKEVKKELKEEMKKEMADIRKEIKEALNEED